MSNKLKQVLDYLLNEQEDKAKDLLHSIFIEKARAIHEELMGMDEDMDDDMEETMGGDMEHDMKHDVHGRSRHLDQLNDEVDYEETMEGEDMDADDAEDDIMDMEDMGDDDDGATHMDDGEDHMEMGAIEDDLSDLDSALQKLKAEFEKLEAVERGEHDDADHGDAGDADDDDSDQQEMDEGEDSWISDDDFAALDEALDLEVVAAHAYDSKFKSAGEVGSGKYAKPEANVKSPIVGRKGSLMGAEPVDIDAGPEANGYSLQAAPKSDRMMSKDNRRKQAMDGTDDMSAGNYGAKSVANSKLEKTASEFGADKGKKSPLSTSPRK